MRTNVMDLPDAPITAGSTWGAVGSGLQGIAALAGAAMQARAADQALKARQAAGAPAPIPGALPADFGSELPMGGDVSAMNVANHPGGNSAANLAALNAQAPAPPMMGGGSAMPRTAANVDVNASVPPIQLALPGLVRELSPGTLNAAARPPMGGGGGAGFQSMFASQFPSLFPQSASQYGGM